MSPKTDVEDRSLSRSMTSPICLVFGCVQAFHLTKPANRGTSKMADIYHKEEIFQPGKSYPKVYSEDIRRRENSTPESYKYIMGTDINLMLRPP